MQSTIAFDLENSSADTDVTAILFPAMLRRNGALAGKFLKGTKFKDDSGTIDINVSDVVPAKAINELNEFGAQLTGIKIISIVVATATLAQATQPFMALTHVPYSDSVVANIPTKTTLVPGKSEVLHTFDQAWQSGAMQTLQMKLLKGEKVAISMVVDMPDFSDTAAIQQAILPNQ
ncbi:hypothetical protein [Spirosoma pomorum]